MLDDRKLRNVSPGRRGHRFAARYRGKLLQSNTRYLVITAAAVTRHYSARGAIDRVRLLELYEVKAAALAYEPNPPRWDKMKTGKTSQPRP